MDRGQKTILFVEDDSFVLTMYRSRLQSAGFHFESAGDGLAAIELLPQVRPDAVVLDLMLPKLHGLEVLKFIRADVNLRATPVVVLSNVYMEGLATKAVEAGCNFGILKTQCSPTKLIRILRELIAKASASGEAPSKTKDRKVPATDSRDVVIEEACRKSARIDLLREAPQEIAQIRQDCLAFLKMGVSKEGLECLNSLYRRVRFLNARAGLSECTRVCEVSSALEAVLFEIVFNSARATRSALQTTVEAVDCLSRLFRSKDVALGGPNLRRKVLAVDDDKVCNCAVVAALKRANFDATSVENPTEALALLEAAPYDLVLLDINMPGLDGFQVCEKLRRIPQHKATPVIFVTMNGEFENRTRGILAGGDALITKPISPLELTLKVTILLAQPSVPDEAALNNVDGAQNIVSPADQATVGAEAASVVSKSTVGAFPPAALAPADQSIEQQVHAEPNLALVRQDFVGANGFDRGEPRGSLDSPSANRTTVMANRGSCDGHRLDEHLTILRVAAEDLNKKLGEKESALGRLRQENEDLKTASKDHVAELAQLNARLEKARAENESLAQQAASLKEEHAATQADQAQHKNAQSKWQLARQMLEQQVKGQAGELAGLRSALEQELAKRERAEAQLRRELEEQKARLQAQTQKLAQEQGKLEAKTQEQEAARAAFAALQDKYAAVERQLESVSQSLAQEAERRAAVEGQAGELSGLRSTLEEELAQRKQAEEQLRRELEEQKVRLQAQTQKLAQEQGKLEATTQEQEAAQAAFAALQDKYAAVEQQLESVSQSLAQEAERRAVVEGQAGELSGLRGALEQELAQRKQGEEQLRRELEEQKVRLQAQTQKLAQEQGKLEAKTQEQEAAQAAFAALQDKYAAVERQLESVSQSLAQETERRAVVEGQAGELSGLRGALEQELAQRKQAEEQLRRELKAEKARLQAQAKQLSEEQGKLEATTQEQEAARAAFAALQDKHAAVERQLESVSQSLAQETERRAAAEGQAGELSGLRGALEQELAQRKQGEEQLRRELEEQKVRLQAQTQKLAQEQGKLEGKTQEQEAAQAAFAALQDKYAAVEQQLESVSQSLAREAECRAAAVAEASELAEARRLLEHELLKHKQAEGQFRRQLDEQKVRLQTQTEWLLEARGKLEAKTQEQQAALTTVAALQDKYGAVERQLESVSQSLVGEAKRRAAAEVQTNELAGLRRSLERELAQRKQDEGQLRRELEEERTRLQAQLQTVAEEQGKLEGKARELEAAQAMVAALQDRRAAAEQQLSESLAREAQLQESVKGRASEVAELRSALEKELAARKQAEGQLRRELEEERTRLKAQAQKLTAERRKLEAKTQDAETAQATVAELRDKYAGVGRQLENVSQSLAHEAKRRAEAETQAAELAGLRGTLQQQLAQHKQAEEQLRRELEEQKGRLQAQAQRLSEEQGKLKAKTQEHEAARAVFAELRDTCSAVQGQLESVGRSLADEAERRAAAETQANELAGLRRSLEQELAQRKQAEEQLRRELEEQKARLQAQAQKLSQEQGKLEAKTQEQEAARAAFAALQDKCVGVERQLESVNQSLALEAERRAAAEGQAGELSGLRGALEQELAHRQQAEAHLRRELEEQKVRLQAQAQRLSDEQGKLEAKTQEQEAARAALAALQDKCAAVERQLESVNQSLALEAERRAAAEGQASELSGLRGALEQELARRQQAEAHLRRELEGQKVRLQAQAQRLSDEQGKLEAKTQELVAAREEVSAARSRTTQEALEKQRLAAKVVEEEYARAELTEQLAAAREREAAGQKVTQSLELQVHSGLAECGRLESSLQVEAAERGRLRVQLENHRARLDDISNQLKEKNEAEVLWGQRQTELQGCIQTLQEGITDCGAALAVREVELRSAKEKTAELLLIQSALCAKVKELTATESASADHRRAVEQQSAASQRRIEDGQKELAALRYAVLEGCRLGSQVSQGYRQRLGQGAADMTHVVLALLSSPLSLPQRRLATSLQTVVEGWTADQINYLSSNHLPVGAPVFEAGEFSLAELAREASKAIRRTAAANGVEAQTTISGQVPEKVVGDPGHLSQLISLLPETCLRLRGVQRLGSEVSVEPILPGPARLKMELLIAAEAPAGVMCERFRAIAAAARTLKTAQLDEAELGLAVCWQLADAIGGTLKFDATADHGVRLELLVPVEIPAPARKAGPAADFQAGEGEAL